MINSWCLIYIITILCWIIYQEQNEFYIFKTGIWQLYV